MVQGATVSNWPNWVDLLVVIVCIRACYVGFARGVIAELLGLAGAVATVSMSINYSGLVMSWVQPWWQFDPTLGAFLMFWLLFLICTLTVRALAKAATQLVKWERVHWLVQSIGLLLGAARGAWWAAFLLVALTSSGVMYLRDAVERHSVIGPAALELARDGLKRVADALPGAAHQTDRLIPPIRPAPK